MSLTTRSRDWTERRAGSCAGSLEGEMRRAGLLCFCLLLTACIARIDFEGGERDGVVTTAAPAPPARLGPEPSAIPPGARTVVMQPGGSPTPDQLSFLRNQAGYLEGSGRVEAYVPGVDGLKALLTWEEDGSARPDAGPGEGKLACDAVMPVGGTPRGWGCGSADDWTRNRLGGYGYSSQEDDVNEIEVRHAPGATATVVELSDGTVYVIRPPATSTISYYEWHGPPSARITVFWPDGTRASELTSPP